MTNTMNLIRIFRAGGCTRRFHNTPMTRPEDVAQHTFGVISIIRALYHPSIPPSILLCAALEHDLPEQMTGDIPSPLKWKSSVIAEELWTLEEQWWEETGIKQIKNLTPDEEQILKAVDMLDMIIKCKEELGMGNRGRLAVYTMGDMIRNGKKYLKELKLPLWAKKKVDELVGEV